MQLRWSGQFARVCCSHGEIVLHSADELGVLDDRHAGTHFETETAEKSLLKQSNEAI